LEIMTGADPAAIAAFPPRSKCWAVIFTSVRSAEDADGYGETSDRMVALASAQPGFLGVESAREDIGITVSYWESLEAIKAWKAVAEHQFAQRRGRDLWYDRYRVRVCRVTEDYGFEA
jgi:heme-degrading monooxygenase HmoA